MNAAAPEPKTYGPDPNKLPAPIEYLDFEVLPVEKPRSIIKGVFDGASRLIFGGGSKTYKSWSMCDMALSLACEVPWLEFDTEFTPGLYVNFELKEFYFKHRLQAICRAKEIKPDKDALHVWNLRGYQIKLGDFIEELKHRVEELKRKVVYIDPFYKLLGDKDERVSSDLNPILAAFDYLNRVTGVSVIMSAHFAKGNASGKEPLDRISGGGSINRDPDTLVCLTAHKNDGEFTCDVTTRDFAPVKPFVVKWNYPLLEKCSSDPKDIKTPGRPRGSGFDPEDLMTLIEENDGELSTMELWEKAEKELGWAKRTFFKKLNELKKAGKIFLSKTDDKWGSKRYTRGA